MTYGLDNSGLESRFESIDDKALMAAHVAGDPDAFAEIFRRHRDRLWAVALRTTGDPEEAADGLQDALISAYRKADTYRADAAVTTWMHRIVVNACLDRLRRNASRPTSPLPESEAEAQRHTATHKSAQDQLEHKELKIELDRALALLPTDQRAAIVLVDVEGYSVNEAAQILDCPPGTIKSRCARGRAKLAVRLAELRNPQSSPNVGLEVETDAEQGGDDQK